MKLGILTALWRRPRISGVVLDYYAGPGLLPEGSPLVAVNSPGSGVAVSAPWREVVAPNSPLSDKWQAGMGAMRERAPDAVMVVGSDDIVSAGYIRDALYHIGKGADLVMLQGLRVYCTETHRAGIAMPSRMGAGRVLSGRLLDRMDWQVWPSGLERRLDGGMDTMLRGVVAHKVRAGGDRACLDIKGPDNMWSFDDLRARSSTTGQVWRGFERQAKQLGINLPTDMASKAAQKKAKELGVDIETVKGTGAGGNVLVSDVEKAAEKPKAKAGRMVALVNIPSRLTGRRIVRGAEFDAGASLRTTLLRHRYAKDA